ncbi:ATP-binding protein [Kitasatospora sp. NPDC007106]|uniref:ATP-binding protein n=1 Tax=Kitasatospora sp. NPDC007106 TaxID=3156914 RepID=UPI0033CA9684
MTTAANHRPHPHLGGRAAALRALARWHGSEPSAPKTVLLTGRAGSGRSRLLTGFLMLCDPDHRKRIDTDALDPATVPSAELPPPLVFGARGLTATQLLWSVADGLGMEVTRTAEVLELLAEPADEGTPLLPVVVPDVDDAGVLRVQEEAARVAAEVLLPLAASPGVRLLADLPRAQARWLAERLPADRLLVLDLDEEPWADREALLLQARHTLGATVAADRLARAADGPLTLRLAAWSLLAVPDGPELPAPTGVGEALDLHAERCGVDELTLRRLLAPLALAAPGEPLPLALWGPLASAVAGKDLGPALASGQRLLLPFTTPAGDDDHPAVRIAHPAVAAEVRERFGGAVREAQRRIAAALTATVDGTGIDGGTADDGTGAGRWERALPYLREQLAGHALEGGLLPELLDDPGFLLHTDQVRLRAAAEHLAAAGPGLPPLARSWLRVAPLFTRHELGPQLRAGLLEHALRQDGLPAAGLGEDLPWRTEWTVPLPGVAALTAATGPDGSALLAAYLPGGEPQARVFDAATGASVDLAPEQLVPPTDEERAACPVRLSTGADYVRIWPREDAGGPLGIFVSAGPLGGADVTPDGLLLLADAAGLSALRLTLPGTSGLPRPSGTSGLPRQPGPA